MLRVKYYSTVVLLVIISLMLGIMCSSPPTEGKATAKEIASLEETVRQQPQNIDAIIKLAKAYQFAGMPEKALRLLENKKKEFPDNAKLEIWYANAESLMANKAESITDKVKWSQRAIGDLDATVNKYANNWYVHFIRGKNSLYWPDMFHRKEVAIQDFEFLLQLKKKNMQAFPDSLLPDILYSLGYAYISSDINAQRGYQLWEKVKDRYPKSEFCKKIDEYLANHPQTLAKRESND